MNTLFGPPTLSRAADIRNPQYQALKGRIHEELLGRLNLEKLARVKREDAEPEIRGLIIGLLDREIADDAPQPVRARCAHHRRPPRDLRPRSARGAAGGSDDLGHPGEPLQPGLHRARGPAGRDRNRLSERRAPVPDHRADRQHGRTPYRRVEPDGRCAPAGRLARQRGHSAAGARRSRPVDPPFQNRPDRRAGSRRSPVAHAADARFPEGRRCRASECHRLGRNRRWQDDIAECAVELHLRQGAHRHHRGRCRTDAAPAPHGPARDPAGQHRGPGRRAPAAARRQRTCVCARIASSSARSAARKRSTCCRR